jgi:hypothetical protein
VRRQENPFQPSHPSVRKQRGGEEEPFPPREGWRRPPLQPSVAESHHSPRRRPNSPKPHCALPPPLALRGCFQPVRVRSRSTPASRSGGDDARGSGHESPRTRSPRATPMASTKGQLQHGSAHKARVLYRICTDKKRE